MRIGNLSLLLAILLGFSACSRKEATEATAETPTQIEETVNNDIRPIEIVQNIDTDSSDAFNVVEVKVDGDILSVTVSYGGGCQDHEWTMYATERYAKSYPPKLGIFLKHKANGDMCKALLRETLKFNLKDVQYKGSDKLHLQMNNYKEFIVYEY